MEPWEAEALSWLRNNRNESALATNRFNSTAKAIEAVKRLYAAGATEVKVGPVLDEPERIKRDGGPYTSSLVVTFPRERTKEILLVIKSLQPDEGGDAKDVYLSDKTHEPTLRLWWD